MNATADPLADLSAAGTTLDDAVFVITTDHVWDELGATVRRELPDRPALSAPGA